MTFYAVTNPRWSASDHSGIQCTVVFEGSEEELPFNAMPTDPMDYGQELYADLVAGKYGDIAEYVRPPVTAEDLQEQFNAIWPDVMLGLADQATIELATNLRKQIKAMQ